MPNAKSSAAAEPAAQRPKLLIVEDHPATLSALSLMLSRAFPHCVLLAAASGEAAMALCLTETPTVVVMDISLPGMNGLEATRAILRKSPQTKVLVHSSSDLAIYRESAKASGAIAFVSKADTARELIPMVQTLLNRS